MSEAAATVVTEVTPAAEPARITVVTPDNFEAYVDQQIGPRKAEDAVIVDDDTDDDAPDTTARADDKSPDKEAKKKGKLNERFSELTQARKQAEEKAEKASAELKAAREAREAAERRANELAAKYEPPKPDEIGPEPVPEQFTDVSEYAKALKDYTADKTRRDDAKAATEKAAAAERQRVADSFIQRQEEFKAAQADYSETLANSDVKVSDEIRDAIVESEVGPQLLYHFAKNPDDAERLGKMTVARALREFGKIEAKLSGEPAPEKTTKSSASVAEISKAPAPINPLKGTSAIVPAKVDTDGNFYGTYEEYKKLRAAGKIK